MKKFFIPAVALAVVLLVGVVFFLSRVTASPKAGAKGAPATVVQKAQSPAPKISPASVKKAAASIPAPPKQAADQAKMIQEIRHELQTVMDLNQKINAVQTSKSAQLLRIQEQAMIHQRILSEIQKASSLTNRQAPSREALLAQEKLRIIREETLRNKKMLESNASAKATP